MNALLAFPGYEARMGFPGYEAHMGFPAPYQGDFKRKCVSPIKLTAPNVDRLITPEK
jgi:hypothetical protein